jgi:hypothetical protein
LKAVATPVILLACFLHRHLLVGPPFHCTFGPEASANNPQTPVQIKTMERGTISYTSYVHLRSPDSDGVRGSSNGKGIMFSVFYSVEVCPPPIILYTAE